MKILERVSALDLKEGYFKTYKDIAGHEPSIQRVERAYNMLTRSTDYTIECTDPTKVLTFVVSNGEDSYTVVPSRQSCTCPDATEGHNLCKHRLAVKILLEAVKRCNARAAWKR